MGFLSPEKLLLIALLVALVFGTKGVPAIARRAGKGIRETRDALGIDAIRDDIHDVRSTFSEPLSITAAPDAPAAATARDEVSNRPVAPALPERPSAV
jgi:TatA/E family protein of Tat protein translocase